MPLLFVYGTLRRGFPNPFSRLLEERAEWLGQAAAPVRLIQVEPFPVAVDASDSSLAGELWRLPDPPDVILQLLDEYEGAEYQRVRRPVQLRGQPDQAAWIYILATQELPRPE